MGLLQWEIRVVFPKVKPAAKESRATKPTMQAGCFHNPLISDMDYRIFIVRTDVNVCDCTRGCTDTVRQSLHRKLALGKNPLSHRGIDPAQAACRFDAPPTELHPHPQCTTTHFMESAFDTQLIAKDESFFSLSLSIKSQVNPIDCS